MGIKELVKQALAEKENKKYQKRLEQIQVTYPDWVARLESQSSAGQQSEHAGNRKESSQAERSFVVICASKGALGKNSIKDIECYFMKHPEVQLLYGDEDVLPGCSRGDDARTERRSPWFKPDWSPDLLDSQLYFGSVIALRKELFQKVATHYDTYYPGQQFCIVCQQIDDTCYEVLDLAAYEKWVHRCVGLAGAYGKGSTAIGHISSILFHSEDEKEQEKFLEESAWRKECKEERVLDFRKSRMSEAPVVSVVIPSKDQPVMLGKCIQGCLLAGRIEGHGGRKNQELTGTELSMEFLVVDNGSSPENRTKVENLVKRLSESGLMIRYLYSPMDFNFSRMCNLGAEQAKGQFLLFLNDDVELCLPGCIEEMAALADRFFTGAVGLKLLYPDTVRIQHAGITNLPMGPVHKLQFLYDNNSYYYGYNRGSRNVLAVTAACLMVEKDKFQETGGFADELPVAFNDVDLCFRLHELGYWNVCVNGRHAYHCESLSRGADESAEKLERLMRERDKLYNSHPQLSGVDPFYSVHLNREGLDTCIRPAYVTAGNLPQQVREPLEKFEHWQNCHQDPCLMVTIEDSRKEKIQGYGVVLGDNNACYKMQLLFKASSNDLPEAMQNSSMRDTDIYAIRLLGQYRPDLEENMPDQINVALSGFNVSLEEGVLPKGRYRMGLTARNSVTGHRLINWSNRYFEVGESCPAV
ncbi:MAG: glycosyltransferase [Acetatifactor sp.]|nr:glycosyltransferase [Acetatifactor sp.]